MFDFIKGKKKKEETLWENFEAEAMPHMDNLFRVAMFLKRNRDLAEELVQETMMQALKSFHRYKLGTNCKAWLTTIMYNTHYKQIKKLTKLQLVEDKEEVIAQTVPFEPSIPQQVTDEDVLHAIKKVPDTFRDIVVMSDVEGFSYKEIASIMNIPMGTVMSRLHRGRKVLRGELAVYAREYGLNVDADRDEKNKKVKSKGGESV